MGTIKLDHYVLILRGDNLLEFIDGISTNKVDGSCTTVFTDKNAKIIDMVDVIEKEDFVALVGHNLYKNSVISHISSRILDANIQIFDITNSNNVFLNTNKSLTVDNATIHESIIGRTSAPSGAVSSVQADIFLSAIINQQDQEYSLVLSILKILYTLRSMDL